MQRVHLLTGGLLAAGALWALSRTERGQVATVDAVDTIVNALTPKPYRNNNPGAIRFIAKNPWNGQVGDDAGIGTYATPELGTRALGKELLKRATTGMRTVSQVITSWAPPNENDTASYVAHVADQLGVAAGAMISIQQRLPDLARAIAKHENGYIDSSYDFDRWVYLA